MERTLIKDTIKQADTEVLVKGWVDARRDHGKLIFIDLIDASGILQVVFTPEDKELLKLADTLRLNDVIEMEGILGGRPEKMVNSDLKTGKLELKAVKLTILNKAETTPFELDKDGYEINEEVRLKYRYIDLRRARLQKNIKKRHEIIQFSRNFLSEKGFIEIETPILTKSTPEGARDYVVPSRLQPGKFYALPQSPQQYKQLLMVAGFEKYFQIARCFRDEDTRGDRQPEFTQLDIEMSFIEQKDIIKLTEELINGIIELTDKKASWNKLNYEEAIKKYKTDKPDLRKDKNDPNEMAFCWILDWPLFGWNENENRWDPMHHIFTAPQDSNFKDPKIAKSWQHDLVLNGYEIGGGSIRIHNSKLQERIFELVGISKEEAKSKFGHLLKAFEYGAPPHGGIAPGLDRLIMILLNEPNIRETMAFPKTGDGRDLMMDAPSEIDDKQLKELGISINKNE